VPGFLTVAVILRHGRHYRRTIHKINVAWWLCLKPHSVLFPDTDGRQTARIVQPCKYLTNISRQQEMHSIESYIIREGSVYVPKVVYTLLPINYVHDSQSLTDSRLYMYSIVSIFLLCPK